MANTTSGTATFDKTFAIDEIIEEAYERIGMQGVSGNQLRMARRSLNIMFQEWGNRGLHYWEVANNSITLVDGQATYTMFRSTDDGTSSATAVYGVDDVLEAVYRNPSNVDSPVTLRFTSVPIICYDVDIIVAGVGNVPILETSVSIKSIISFGLIGDLSNK